MDAFTHTIALTLGLLLVLSSASAPPQSAESPEIPVTAAELLAADRGEIRKVSPLIPPARMATPGSPVTPLARPTYSIRKREMSSRVSRPSNGRLRIWHLDATMTKIRYPVEVRIWTV